MTAMKTPEEAAREFFGCESLGINPEVVNEDGTEGAPTYIHRCSGKCEALASLLRADREAVRQRVTEEHIAALIARGYHETSDALQTIRAGGERP